MSTSGKPDTTPSRLHRKRIYAALLDCPDVKALPSHAYDLVLAVAKMAETTRVEASHKDAELSELRKQVTRLTTANEQLSKSMATILEKRHGN